MIGVEIEKTGNPITTERLRTKSALASVSVRSVALGQLAQPPLVIMVIVYKVDVA